MTTMLLVMVDIAKRNEVFSNVFSLVYVVLNVMKFKHLSGVFRRKQRSAPSTSDTLEPVPLQHSDSHRVRYFSVVLVSLSIFFKHIHSDL